MRQWPAPASPPAAGRVGPTDSDRRTVAAQSQCNRFGGAWVFPLRGRQAARRRGVFFSLALFFLAQRDESSMLTQRSHACTCVQYDGHLACGRLLATCRIRRTGRRTNQLTIQKGTGHCVNRSAPMPKPPCPTLPSSLARPRALTHPRLLGEIPRGAGGAGRRRSQGKKKRLCVSANGRTKSCH